MNIARQLLTPLLLGICWTLSGCTDKLAQPQGASTSSTGVGAPAGVATAPIATPKTSAPITITTVKAEKRDLAIALRASGTVTALTSVDVRSQVNSTIRQVHFSEGQFVKAGQLLFMLDSRTDQANAAKAQAQLAKDRAAYADAKRQSERAKQLFLQNFISQGAVDTAQTQVESAAATLAADQAAIDAINVALSFARITAPHAGRAGAVNVSSGSAVQANVTALVTITQLDPIAVAFNIPQRNLTDALSALNSGGAAITATLADGGGIFNGRLQFIDNAVDASSGTVKAKAVFANKENKLWPGAFVEVAQTVATVSDAVILPQAAIVQSARGPVVYVVEAGKAQLRPVKLVNAQGGEAAVTGVSPGESIVMDGKQNVRPGSLVVERAKETQSAKP
jgi:RND family efflux transporter MFP subunit